MPSAKPGLAQHPINTGGTDGHDVLIEHHEAEPAAAFQRILVTEGYDRIDFPALQPEVARHRRLVDQMLAQDLNLLGSEVSFAVSMIRSFCCGPNYVTQTARFSNSRRRQHSVSWLWRQRRKLPTPPGIFEAASVGNLIRSFHSAFHVSILTTDMSGIGGRLFGLSKVMVIILLLFFCLYSPALYTNVAISDFWRESAAIFRDSQTQWIAVACLGIYFVTFLLLRRRCEGGDTSVVWRFQRSDMWLVGAMLISVIAYAVEYVAASKSTEALTWIFGAILGQAAGFWLIHGCGRMMSNGMIPTFDSARMQSFSAGETRIIARKCGPLLVIPAILMMLLVISSSWDWQTDRYWTFEYRGVSRSSGPWDNPNVFGLLMGTGLILAIGLAVERWNAADGRWEMEVGRWKLDIKNHTGIILCLVAAMLMGRGLFHSFSRGAWLATLVGVGCFIVYWMLKQHHPRRTEANSPEPGGAENIVRQTNCFGSASGPRVMGCASRHWFLLSVLVLSLIVVSFWHLRHTEWRPVRRAFSVGNANDFSWRNRVAAWEGAFQMMSDKPLLGMGWNQPELIYETYYRSAKISEGMAIQMNDYLMLGATLGIPALVCFGMYLWLSLTQRDTRAPAFRMPETGWKHCSTLDQLQATCRAGAIVLLVGFWFDGGLFKLATGSVFWVLLELGRRDLINPEEIKETELTTIESSRTPA